MKIPKVQNLIGVRTQSSPAGETPRHPFNPTFGIYLKTTPKYYGHITHGAFKGHSIDIYNAYNNGLLRHKLYYVKNAAGNWIKSKLKFYHNGEFVGQARAENVVKSS